MVSAGGVAGDAWDAGSSRGNGAGPARWLGKRPRRPAPVPSSTPSPSRPRPRWSSSEPGTWGSSRGPRPVSRRVGDGGRRPAGVREPRALPEADRVVAAPVGETFGWLPVGPGTAVVVAMRNQDLDYEATAAALQDTRTLRGADRGPAEGDPGDGAAIADGVPIERVRALRAPIGLDIGARTPEEIAVSILAEWLMVRQGAPGARSVSTSSSSRRPPGAEPPRRPGPGNGVRVVPPESRPETRRRWRAGRAAAAPAPEPTGRADPGGLRAGRRARHALRSRGGLRVGRLGGRRRTPTGSSRWAGSSRGSRPRPASRRAPAPRADAGRARRARGVRDP